MANLKQRLHRKNSSGSYDVIYLETLASLVKMDDGTTLTSKISSMDTAINGKAASGHTHSAATTSAAGFMTGDMVTKLNGIAAGANKYTHPSDKQCNYAYTHPSTKQCNYSVDTSGFATTTQLNEVKKSVSNGKSAIASAITDKGVSTAASADFSTMASNIRNIPVGSTVFSGTVDGTRGGTITISTTKKCSNVILAFYQSSSSTIYDGYTILSVYNNRVSYIESANVGGVVITYSTATCTYNSTSIVITPSGGDCSFRTYAYIAW